MPNPKQIEYQISTTTGMTKVTGHGCGRQQSLAVRREAAEFVIDHVPSGRRIAGFLFKEKTEKVVQRTARQFGVELDQLLGGLLREKDHNQLRDAMPVKILEWVIYCETHQYVPFGEFNGGDE